MSQSNEWNAAKACEFWPDQRGHWAPVSWKDHLHDFNVFFNGTILADPAGIGLNPNIRPEHQIFAAEVRTRLFAKEPDVKACDGMVLATSVPDGRHIASWLDSAAPVYVIEHSTHHCPVYVQQRQFAHVPGGRAVQRGDEPLFLWVRFVVHDLIEILHHREHVYLGLTVLKPSLRTGMGSFNNLNFNHAFGAPVYPLPLAFEYTEDLSKPAFLRCAPPSRIRNEPYLHGWRNRLAIPSQRNVRLTWHKSPLFAAFGEELGHLVFRLPARKGARADFLLPFVPVDDATIERELALGYDGALRETERFWRRAMKTRTSIRVPEPLLQGNLDHFPRLEAMIAETHPATGDRGLPSGSYHYEAIWATPMALNAWALDAIGYGHEVDAYLETYRRHQGTIAPPSPCLKPHPGYLGSPKTFTSIDWITDHAAILWAASNHALISMDRDFLRRWTQPIVAACEFVHDARRTKGHKGFPGLLPPAVANDCNSSSQSVWNDAWHHKALRTAATLLTWIGHPRGREFRREADAYRAAFQDAYRRVVARSKRWRAPDGTRVPFTPPTLAEAKGFEAAHAFHLDTGAMVLVFGELFPADDPIMRASVRWFREGPQVKHFRRFSSEWQMPVLYGEISSCEPCYSWNVFHTFELGDREKFTQGLYSLFAGGICRQNFVSCETREAVSGNCFTHGLALMAMRLAVIEERGDELHLLRMTPRAFFENGGFHWKLAPTWFGELNLAARFDARTGTLDVRYSPPKRSKPGKTVLHVPPIDGLRSIRINGEPTDTTGNKVTIG